MSCPRTVPRCEPTTARQGPVLTPEVNFSPNLLKSSASNIHDVTNFCRVHHLVLCLQLVKTGCEFGLGEGWLTLRHITVDTLKQNSPHDLLLTYPCKCTCD